MSNFKAIDIAEWFLWYNQTRQLEQMEDNDDVYEGLTHLKVQKLLYYAEGVNLAVNNKSLFEEDIIAWPHGPVVKSVYEILKNNGKKEIDFNREYWNTIKKMNEDVELYNILETVYNNYAGFTAWQLREKTHIAGGPWQITVDSKGMESIIDKELIKDYFVKHIIQINE